jgi:hypothetical protein
MLFACGGCLGLLVGLLIGLSVSPVVASVTSALVGLVVAYAGIRPRVRLRKTSDDGEPGKGGADAHEHRSLSPSGALVYIAGFSSSAVVAILGGLAVRAHGLLSPSPREIVSRWEQAGLTPAQAQQVALNVLDTRVDLSADPLFFAPGAMVAAWMDAGMEAGDARDLARARWSAPPPRSEVGAEPPREPGGRESSPEGPKKAVAEGPNKTDGLASHPSSDGADRKTGGPVSPALSTLIAGDTTFCEELMSKVRTEQWGLVEDQFASGPNDWKAALDAAHTLPEAERHQALKTFARAHCGRSAK